MSKQSVMDKTELTEEQVIAYLRAHPELLGKHPELLTIIAPPKRELGDGVVDFQHFQLKNLQANTKNLRSKYEGLVDFCRDNLSVQSQVHDAVIKLIKSRTLEQLLEVLVMDFVTLFDLDVVRIGVESPFPPEHFFRANPDYESSGIGFVPEGTIDAALGKGKSARLVDDTLGGVIPGFPEIFIDFDELIRSCALLRLKLPRLERDALLAFGVRHEGRFQPGQGTELLSFLAEIVAHELDAHLDDMAL